ncbi:hypothetical protein AGABI1DRAFT_110608 [Agaricus bisporus var. burnettii JB137-S8]|uniref:CRAL-TRIO domain-containing protein n=2 Tax=Agaricus bisporus var. burnettii TaxID=192524 RepID=K5WAT3_AGABU|nr:uncharacterized protein AGABI1DRAFT_110608 [Agaricus bisporus var. burnettii JB137-S8]EKM84004.1 hypothetical protein AGABI1DRAFT_110608 [Agaricus bisporus var. burnettii JB137-S8]KAF7784195.1 hypothetical protein Agabi119p4_360 [Agaricus bisporus var. burnettii]
MANPTQQDTLHKFRQQLFEDGILQDGDTIGTDDETLLRFLHARSFDIALSKKMFADCQHWRKTVQGVGIDRIYSQTDPFDYPERETVFKFWPMWFHKTDKQGRPINVQILGKMDLSKLYKVCTPKRHWETVLANAECLPREVLPAASRVAGRHIGTTLVIVDLKGFSLSQFWQAKSIARDSFQMSQDFYPETMGELVIINAPSSFTIIWNVIKPWLARDTAQKVSIYGKDYQKALLDLVDAESLPASLGGKCTCKDLGGCEFSGAGPWLDGRKGWGPRSKARLEEANSEVMLSGAAKL